MSKDVAATSPARTAERRELVFAFVAPLGVDRERVVDALRKALDPASYDLEDIRVSNSLNTFVPTGIITNSTPYLYRKKLLMDAGDIMRRQWSQRTKSDRASAVAIAGIEAIRQKRQEKNQSKGVLPHESDNGEQIGLTQIPVSGTAYLLDSLKHPHELQLLRSVYGPAFVSVGIYSPPEARKAFLKRKSRKADIEQWLETLIERDEFGAHDDAKLGQRVSDAFNQTDFIVDATLPDHKLQAAMTRLVELIFGNMHLTPSLDEMGMYLARAAQVRSGSLARQVGASILRDDGSIVAVGTNEVAKPLIGGQYWAEDDEDPDYKGRDRVYRSVDTSDEFRAKMVKSILDKLADHNLLVTKLSNAKIDPETRLKNLYGTKDSPLRGGAVAANIDYIRAVHAEAASLLDCARHGVPTLGTQMFATTFPCHECSRHIVAAGIKRVVYLEPYPKSATKELFQDSISIDPSYRTRKKVVFTTFIGVAPARYLEFFTAGERKRKDENTGEPIDFALTDSSKPHLPYYTPTQGTIMYNEINQVGYFTDFLASLTFLAKSTRPQRKLIKKKARTRK